LENIEKDIELNKLRGNSGAYAMDDVEECRRHIELIVDLCKDIREACHYDVRRVFGEFAEILEEKLAFIRKNEVKINQNNA